ncbi:MAG: hypothetical protein IPP68_06170 [Elusimicrobia bacterium]|jgi:hypothetical protein|nr:hypothetical protein [Elusimicrobiota bacterium]
MVSSFFKKKTAADFAGELAGLLGPQLVSIVLHGSAASGNFVEGHSDQNLIVVLKDGSLPVLKRALPAVWRWRKSGQPIPVFFSKDGLSRSVEDFPVEFLDLRDGYRVLAGADVIAPLHVQGVHLRHQIEHELKGKLLRLRRAYFEAGGRRKDLLRVMVQSVSGVLVLFRHALRLFGEEPPVKKTDALGALARKVSFDADVVGEILSMKTGVKPAGDPDVLFDRYLKAIDDVLAAVDAL